MKFHNPVDPRFVNFRSFQPRFLIWNEPKTAVTPIDPAGISLNSGCPRNDDEQSRATSEEEATSVGSSPDCDDLPDLIPRKDHDEEGRVSYSIAGGTGDSTFCHHVSNTISHHSPRVYPTFFFTTTTSDEAATKKGATKGKTTKPSDTTPVIVSQENGTPTVNNLANTTAIVVSPERPATKEKQTHESDDATAAVDTTNVINPGAPNAVENPSIQESEIMEVDGDGVCHSKKSPEHGEDEDGELEGFPINETPDEESTSDTNTGSTNRGKTNDCLDFSSKSPTGVKLGSPFARAKQDTCVIFTTTDPIRANQGTLSRETYVNLFTYVRGVDTNGNPGYSYVAHFFSQVVSEGEHQPGKCICVTDPSLFIHMVDHITGNPITQEMVSRNTGTAYTRYNVGALFFTPHPLTNEACIQKMRKVTRALKQDDVAVYNTKLTKPVGIADDALLNAARGPIGRWIGVDGAKKALETVWKDEFQPNKQFGCASKERRQALHAFWKPGEWTIEAGKTLGAPMKWLKPEELKRAKQIMALNNGQLVETQKISKQEHKGIEMI